MQLLEEIIKLRDLQYLVALAEHRHFGRAAAACFVSQPTLSAQVQKLEQELGVQLIDRGVRPLLLTDVGQSVLERARNILREVEQIRDLARSSLDPGSGVLRLGVIPTLAAYLLPLVLGCVHQRFPRLELLITEEKTAELVAGLRQGRVDVAIMALPVADDALHTEVLFDEPFVLATPADDPLAGRASVDLRDLQDRRVLLLDEGHCLRDQALAVCGLAGAQEMAGFRATSLETLRQMVAIDMGITLLPALAMVPPAQPGATVALIQFRQPQPTRQIAMCWRQDSARADFLRDKLAPLFSDPVAAILNRATGARNK